MEERTIFDDMQKWHELEQTMPGPTDEAKQAQFMAFINMISGFLI